MGTTLALGLAVVRIISLILFASCLRVHAEEAAVGRWQGAVEVPGREMKAIVDLARQNEAWVGSITLPGRLIKGAELTEIVASGPDISFAIKNTFTDQKGGKAVFKGRVEGGRLTGNFLQGGNTAPFALERSGPAQVEFPPQSTAIAKELEGEWRGEYELFGYGRKVTIKLTNRPSGGATAEFVIVGKKVNNIPVDLVTQEGKLLTIDSSSTGLSYEGLFQNGEIKGTIAQGSFEKAMVLQRAK